MHVVITGANRGLGLEFVRQCLSRGDTVTAGCRHPDDADDLHALRPSGDGDRLRVVEIDVARDASVSAAAAAITQPIDLLINNAGLYGGDDQSLAAFDSQVAAKVYDVNVLGVLRMLQAMQPHLAGDARVVSISSGYGSIANSAAGWPLWYCASKAGVNMVAKIVGQSWADTDRCVVAMSPGWVQTDMGGANADLTPAESIGNMLAKIDTLGPADTGGYFNHDGRRLPW